MLADRTPKCVIKSDTRHTSVPVTRCAVIDSNDRPARTGAISARRDNSVIAAACRAVAQEAIRCQPATASTTSYAPNSASSTPSSVAANTRPGGISSTPGSRAGTSTAGSTAPARPLIAFAHLADTQMVDEESPARVELVDFIGGDPFSASYRPQEGLMPQVLNEEVRHYYRWCTPLTLVDQERTEDFYASDISISAGA